MQQDTERLEVAQRGAADVQLLAQVVLDQADAGLEHPALVAEREVVMICVRDGAAW